jgi:hypothetical protein
MQTKIISVGSTKAALQKNVFTDSMDNSRDITENETITLVVSRNKTSSMDMERYMKVH